MSNRFAVRRRQPEIMDDPSLDSADHRYALASLARLNLWSRSVGVLWSPIQRLAKTLNTDSLTMLDIAGGAGDVPIGLWHKARRAGLNLQIVSCDISSCAVETARARAAEAVADVQFEQRDILRNPPSATYDVVASSLFLHHLDEADAVRLLSTMAGAAQRLVLVNDLERSRLNYALTMLGAYALTRSRVVHVDAGLSVEGAFSLDEIRALAEQAGLKEARVARRFPCRMLLSWQASNAARRERVQSECR